MLLHMKWVLCDFVYFAWLKKVHFKAKIYNFLPYILIRADATTYKNINFCTFFAHESMEKTLQK